MSRKKLFSPDENNGKETAAGKVRSTNHKKQFGEADPAKNKDSGLTDDTTSSSPSSSGDDWTVHDFTESKD